VQDSSNDIVQIDADVKILCDLFRTLKNL
jgi:hypothetical protein